MICSNYSQPRIPIVSRLLLSLLVHVGAMTYHRPEFVEMDQLLKACSLDAGERDSNRHNFWPYPSCKIYIYIYICCNYIFYMLCQSIMWTHISSFFVLDHSWHPFTFIPRIYKPLERIRTSSYFFCRDVQHMKIRWDTSSRQCMHLAFLQSVLNGFCFSLFGRIPWVCASWSAWRRWPRRAPGARGASAAARKASAARRCCAVWRHRASSWPTVATPVPCCAAAGTLLTSRRWGGSLGQVSWDWKSGIVHEKYWIMNEW